ncbi:MAG: substrate-binding domain-containing protein [Spirochaetales bacterium]|nr:substrate-binding domain-containing protein [Spirochaetales bacterium]
MTDSFTIGMIGDELDYDIPILYFRAIRDIALQYNINLLHFTGKPIRSPFNYSIQANILYELINEQNIDGLIIESNVIASYVPEKELIDLCHKYHSLPIVSVGAIVEGIPSVVNDNTQGMYEAVSHLIEVHDHQHIAYILGPEEHPDVQERYNAYIRAMNDHDLSPDPKLTLPGNFQTSSGHQAVSELIDQRNQKPGRDFDAFVCTNDYMAFGVIAELQSRGIRIPEDIAVVGFDNNVSARFFSPALSTVHQFFEEMGKQAAELLLRYIKGEDIPAVTRVPTQYIQRQSCGCKNPDIIKPEKALELPADVFTAITSNPREFLQYLSSQIYDSGLSREELLIWEHIFTMLYQPERWDWGMKNQGKSFGQYAWTEMGKASYQMFRDINYTKKFLVSGMNFISTLDIAELMNILIEELQSFGVQKCYLVLYENPPAFTYPQTPPQWSRLILAYDMNGRIELPPEGLLFQTRSLVPEGFLKKHDRLRMVMEALYFRDEQIGFWLIDSYIKNEKLYPILTVQIASSLHGALLLKQFQERTRELAIANKEIQILNRQLKDENLRINTEMEVARHIQISLLPEVIKTIHPDFEITARMLTAAEVGGDYYDIALDREGTLWLGIGDVSGHGVASGLVMMMAQTVHTTITTNYNISARDIVIMVNNVLFKNITGRMGETLYMTFTTLKYLGKGQFQYAGLHLDLIIYRQHTGTCELIETRGMWLNVKPDIRENTKNAEFSLEIGDVLVLFTDGLTEVFNREKKILDIYGFKDIVAAHGGKDVEAMQEAIFRDVTNWCNGDPRDDMSLVLVRRVR